MKTPWLPSELTYCTNVHQTENLAQVRAIIRGPLSAVRQKRELPDMAGGLWLSDSVARELASGENLSGFARELERNAITLFTLNGFPARDFHAQRVKEAVYRPDWSEPERLDYTIRLARILAGLLPPDVSEGTISSVPLGFAPGWNRDRQDLAMDALCRCCAGLDQIHDETGSLIRLCLEMEPGCVLESTDALIPFFTSQLPEHAAGMGLDPGLINRHLGICFDVCHQAVMFEDCYASLQQIQAAGISIGKIQISSALELKDPGDRAAVETLARFVEQKYLHQSRCMDRHGHLHAVMDLDQAFRTLPTDSPWRVHFHVPVQAQSLINSGLGTTQAAIDRTLDFLRDNPAVHPHLEVETYTWSVLPQDIRPTGESMMVDGLSRELCWLEARMQQRDLLQRAPA